MSPIIGLIELAVIFLILAVPLIVVVRLMRNKQSASRLSEEDSKIVQDLYQGLKKMENRIDSLETILMDREKGQ